MRVFPQPPPLRNARSRLAAAALVLLSAAPATAHEPGAPDEDTPALRTAPVLIERSEAEYPKEAREQGLGATVSLEITVADDGSVTDVKVVRGAGHGFDEAAVAAARRFRFKPALDRGRPVGSTVLFDQHFLLRPHLAAESTAEPAPTAAEPAASASTIEPAAAPAPNRYRSIVSDLGPRGSATATTIRGQDFELRPLSSPNDLLRVVPGLLAVQHQGGGKADQLFLRGFDADHGSDVAVFVDGVPVNLPSHAHGQGYADLQWLIPEAIERIDVTKGPYDARWGDFATAGAVNLVTRNAFPESSVQVSLGGFPSLGCTSFPLECRPVASQRFVGIAAPRFSGLGERLHAFAAFEAARDMGPFESPERLKRYNLFTKWSFDATPRTSFGMFFSAYGSSWIGSGQIPQREVAAGRLDRFGAIDPSEGGATARQMITAFLRHKDEGSELTATVYAVHYKLALWNDFTFFLRDPQYSDEIEQDDGRWYTGARLAYHFHKRLRRISLRTTLGAEARWDGAHVERWNATSQDGYFRKRLGHYMGDDLISSANDADIAQMSVSAFAEENVVFNKYVRLLAALRADYIQWNVNDRLESLDPSARRTSGTADIALLSPKASAVVTPLPGWLDLYLNFGMGFHSNQAPIAIANGLQASVQNGDGTMSSFRVRAVPRLYGGEIGARAHLFGRVELAAALWASYLDNETQFDADSGSFVPAAPTRRLGVDAELRAQILSWLFADFDLSQAASTAVPDAGNGGAVALAPRLYMTGGLTARHARTGLRGGLRFRYLGPRPAFEESSPEYQYFTSRTLPDGRPNPDYDPSRVTVEGYFVVDAFVAWRWRFLELSLSAQNLLNAAWREAQFGNRSCTYDETYNPMNPNYSGSGNLLADGTYVNRCGILYGTQRSGVPDVHYTPGVPIALQLMAKAYF